MKDELNAMVTPFSLLYGERGEAELQPIWED